MSERILVAGLGNVLMGDDAIGPYCAERLYEGYWFPRHVEIVDLGTPGLGLAVHLSNADRVLVIDAIRGVPPGTIASFDCDAIMTWPRDSGLEAHAQALAEAIQIARLAGDRPRDVKLVGLAGASFDQGTALSHEARSCLPWLTACVLKELSAWGVEWEHRPRVKPALVWWEEQPDAQRGSIRSSAPLSSAVST